MPLFRAGPTRRRRLLLAALLALVALAPLASIAPTAAQAATTNTITLRAFGIDPRQPAAAPTPIASFKYIINEDNVGSTTQPRDAGCSQADADYPANCDWPSIRAQTGYAPIVTQGDASDFAPGGDFAAGLSLPDGNYLVSIIADGYKIDGAWFTLPAPAGPSGLVEVAATLNVNPLPTATLRTIVFNDNAPTNGAPDVPAEPGLPGFRVTVSDTLGEITNDVYGNPICTNYERDTNGDVRFDADGAPIVDASSPIISTGCLYTDANGEVAIPNMGPNRYTMLATPPDGQAWIQTATLEGNHDWDVWVQEGATGYDTEFAVAGEPFPWVPFGFVKPSASPTAGVQAGATGGIRGNIMAVTVYTPGVNGLPYSGSIWAGLSGAKLDKPIENAWLSLSDLQSGDRAVWVGQADGQGHFLIPNVPDGDYMLTWWDQDQLYLLDWQQVSVKNGQITDVGRLDLTAWYAHLSGRVCLDANYDGSCQSNEQGLAGFPIAVKRRTNSVMDRGNQGAVTDSQGNYTLDSVYPLTQWLVIEAYSDTFYTTGVTYQADNDPNEHKIEGAGVDVNFLSVIGQNGRLDWAVQRYNALAFVERYDPQGNLIPHNGGIVGTVSYDTTRNELDPRYAAVENWQPGVPDLTVNLYRPVPCSAATFTPAVAGETCVANPNSGGFYVANPDGSLKFGPLLNTYLTESWARPTGCTARGPDGQPLDPSFYRALPSGASPSQECIEAPLAGIQFGGEYAAVDGNYGFTDGCLAGAYDPATGACSAGDFAPLPAGDYLVDVVIPEDAFGRPKYNVTREEDINVFSGDSFVPQVGVPVCAGPLHTVDVAGVGADGPAATDNPTLAENGGSPFEGQARPLCNTKLVNLANGKSIAPTFNLFTDVPLPGRWYGYIVDDLNLSTNPLDALFGEKAGFPNAPIGIYDYANRLVRTVSSDPNGVFEVLLPSTTTINCPTPTGVCANLFRIVGNDPGVPGKLNPNYNPQFRTIAATFEIFPGDIEPADLAPTQIGVSIQAPGSQINGSVSCRLDVATPQLFAVDRPYVQGSSRTITITGQGFGDTPGTVTLDGVTIPTSAWGNYQITASVPPGFTTGPQQLLITAASGQTTVNGLTIHVIGTGYQRTPLEVGANKPFRSIQAAIDAAPANGNGLIVVYPGGVPDSANPTYNPQLAYFENLIISKALRLQGVGPGGVFTDASGNAVSVNGQTTVNGSIIDGSAFGGDTALANTWRTRMANLLAQGWQGNQTIYEGAVITAVAPRATTYGQNRPLVIDGFAIQGGNQQGFPGNIGDIYGLPNGVAPAVETQGGGIYANSSVDYLTVSNNILQANGGAYGGAVRVGTPSLPGQLNDNQNDRLAILRNRLIANGGTNLAGAVGLFAGTQSYEIAYNDFCGNFSAEYGGAISHYGYSGGGAVSSIHDNRVYFNRSYDEGGAIMIAGELPADPATLSRGAGPVNIYGNLIQANLSNDDGGGIRFLQAGNFPFNVYNNIIANNISTHEGGGVALDDAPNVRFFNNTVMKNITTATALTSNGDPAPAGLSTTLNSDQLQATLPAGSPLFSKPLLFNNVFWDNRAGRWNKSTSTLSGIGAGGAGDINLWDMAVAGGGPGDLLEPTSSILNVATGTAPSATNRVGAGFDPAVVDATYNVSVLTLPWRALPGMQGTTLLAVDLPPNLMGNYHLAGRSSPAVDAGAASKAVPSYQRPAATLAAPTTDIDGQSRPALGGYDMGADEVQSSADLAITIDDGVTSAGPGQRLSYRIVASNLGPDAVSGARVVGTIPSMLGSVAWTCSATPGSSCRVNSGTGNLNRLVDLAQGGSVTIVLNATVSASPGAGPIVTGASVTPPAGTSDPNTANNSASDSDAIPTADLSITTTDGATTASPGASVSYTIVVANAGPAAVTNAPISSSVTTLTGVTWTCTGCAAAGGSGGSLSTTASLPAGGSATLRVTGTVPTGLNGGTIVNSVSVAAPAGVYDPAPGNNSTTDTDLVNVALPSLGSSPLDTFNRGNANTLGGNWSQVTLFGAAAIRVNSNQASAPLLPGNAYWNAASFGGRQGAAFTFANGTTSGAAIVLKASGGTTPSTFARVRYQGGQVIIETTTNGIFGLTTRATFAASFAQGDTLAATAYPDGTINAFKNGTIVASATIPTSGAGAWAAGANGGRVGLELPSGGRADNFYGATLP